MLLRRISILPDQSTPNRYASWRHIAVILDVIIALLCIALHSSMGTILPVTTTSDVTGQTLRSAIMNANLMPGRDTIVFGIPGSGPFTITPLSQFPQLTDPAGVMIDGFTQSGSSRGSNPPSTLTLMIIIDGSNAGLAHGFWIVSPLNTIQGLVIQNFSRDGIRIQATPSGTHANLVYCNFIGTNVTGMNAQGNGKIQSAPWAGVDILVDPGNLGTVFNNTVRRCLISSNYAQGVSISSCPPGDAFLNVVDSNFIGTAATGLLPLGNLADGVYIGEAAHDNIVSHNLISANDTDGVCIVGYVDQTTQWYTRRNIITRNVIGLAVNRTTPLPNRRHGVSIGIYGQVWKLGFAPENIVSYDTIAHNLGCGIMIWEHGQNVNNADRNRITQNAVYGNGRLGIDLDDDGVSANDPNDADSSANQCLNMPIITSAQQGGMPSGPTTVTGTLTISTNPATATVEVFKASSDPTGYGEGAQYLASATPDNAGNWTCTIPATVLFPGDSLTATATDQNGNTSEFSPSARVFVPVELESFSGTEHDGTIILRWTTAAESGNAGWFIERQVSERIWTSVAWIEGQGTTSESHTYSYIDLLRDANGARAFVYRLKQLDCDGMVAYSPELTVWRVAHLSVPLCQPVYPNPASTECVLPFWIPTDMPVRVRLFDAAGKIVSDVTEEAIHVQGSHMLRVNLLGLRTGTYFLSFEAGQMSARQRILVQR